MATTTYVARTSTGYETRSSDTMAYTHAVLIKNAEGEGTLSWHKSEANAHTAMKAASKWVPFAGKGGWDGATMRVVPVEKHQGGKAAVERKLAAEAKSSAVAAAAKAPAKVTAKAPAKKATKTAPAKKAATTKKATTKKAAPNNTHVAKSTPRTASKNSKLVHPGTLWLSMLADKGMSGAAAARQMGIAPMTLNRLLNGHGIPTARVTIAFARVIGQPVEQVWGEVAAYELALAQQSSKK